MKKIFALLIAALLGATGLSAQDYITTDGKCGKDVAWTFDGKTLTLTNTNTKGFTAIMDNYDAQKHLAPWIKKKLNVQAVRVGRGIENIGSCAFAGCRVLTEVIFDDNVCNKIGWGAFMDCERLVNIALPKQLKSIGTIAFANCRSLTSVKVPDQCHVQDQAFLNCSSVRSIEVSPTATLGRYVFASEIRVDGKVRHTLYNDEVRRLPIQINSRNGHTYGFSKDAIERYRKGGNSNALADYDYITSEVDSIIPSNIYVKRDTYALIIGNENYRFVPQVPYAIHDARVFRQYCEQTLGLPAEHIHICEDATKQIILEDELPWLESIPNRDSKKLIVYYAGHGVPDVSQKNKAYLLPTDVRGTKPANGIALDDFYARIGDLAFSQTCVFLDACFSGIDRDNRSVNEGERGVEIAAEEGTLTSGNVVVFSAAQGNETAQGYQEQGHGLFTYYLLKSLQYTSGYVTFGELSDILRVNVSKRALELKQRKPQTPSTSASPSVSEIWRSLMF